MDGRDGDCVDLEWIGGDNLFTLDELKRPPESSATIVGDNAGRIDGSLDSEGEMLGI